MKNLEHEVREYLRERGWDNLTPSDVAKSITIEAAELLELFQWDNKSLAETKDDEARMKKIKKELADVFIYCLDMAVLLNLDSEAIVQEKLTEIKNKYPAAEINSASKQGHERYLEIKKQYRKEGQS